MAGSRRKKRGKLLVELKVNAGIRCRRCGKRYLNPFAHVCKVKFGEIGKRRIEKKKGR